MTYYETAAKWWADKVRNVGPGNFNNGDDSTSGGMAMILATMLAMDKEPDSESADQFEKILSEHIRKRVEDDGYLILDCDYGPCTLLSNVAKVSGVDASCFPWKTNMNITKEEVKVSCGYGAAYKKIYPQR